MSVRVELSGQLATFAGKSVVECDAAASVSEMLANLVREYPKLKNALFDEAGNWRSTTLVALDGKQIHDRCNTTAKDGAEILLLMPMAGG